MGIKGLRYDDGYAINVASFICQHNPEYVCTLVEYNSDLNITFGLA